MGPAMRGRRSRFTRCLAMNHCLTAAVALQSYMTITAIAISMIVLLTNHPAHAAEVSCAQSWGSEANDAYIPEWFPSGRRPNASNCRAVLIRGNIEAGDYSKFAYFLGQNHPFVEFVVLVSAGGQGDEALKIGRMIRQYLLKTRAPYHVSVTGVNVLYLAAQGSFQTICEGPACHCASACFLIWAAGANRFGDAIGVHRPTIQSTAFANLPPEQASTLYRGLLADIATYLSDMEVPKKYIDLMSDTASSDIEWLSSEEALSMGQPGSLAEWLAATCGAVTKEDSQQFLELTSMQEEQWKTGRLLPNGKLLSDQDQMLLDANMAKTERIGICQDGKKAQFRDAMAPPAQAVSDRQGAVQNTAPARCTGERLAVAQRFAQHTLDYAIQALALCPAEFCSTLGQRIVDLRGPESSLQVLKYCPGFCPTVGRRFLQFHNPKWDLQVVTLCPNL